MKIGICGGSFDPVHNGHLVLVKTAIKELNLDKVLVIPASVSPFKQEVAPSNSYDRLLLVRAAFNGVEKTFVDDREIRRGGVSYAIDTVREIKAENPDAELVFLVGDDSTETLSKWKDYDELKTLCTFYAVERTKESSTKIRELLAKGEAIDDMVPYPVAEFIKLGITYTNEEKVKNAVLAGLVRKEGFCPCRLPKNAEFFCPCDEFKGQMADPNYHGLCHCRLYLKP